ncbi:CaiB/BaiF CoA transferase family protein [Hydrogenophaga laconesensis]|uniref:Crotonobetainyl-CoA:carnitine CoA-transferase CaiB-like acyl-CoA transferase n=1 Tax=Hydrogenophaga laconesensis TaxID=1805971 RepID=A0ABU1VJD4_9BURK|nr:CoA transferase [Hydrogenophaga laconesensis]MDR7097596.1 crotonobetainyl-CoA:carnitine CoA-transferase CaiB-like acyl-CoA transferase [Hydrogenophaga laconesensis]
MKTEHQVKGPLAGMKVIDLTTVVMGPYASQTLAEYGAEVIKIEAPGGDSTRQIGPELEVGMASLFLAVNRNKRSVVLDLKTDEGRAALLALVKDADVFMHNMRPEKLRALDLGASRLRQLNPRLVFAELTGFSSSGPYAGLPAYDDVIQGLSGLAAMMERQIGEPRYMPTTLADKVGSMVAAGAIMAALVRRATSGEGATVEIPMFEAVVSFGLVEHAQGALFDPPVSAVGYRRAFASHRKPFVTADGHICVMPYSDAHWSSILKAFNDCEAGQDPRYSSLSDRTKNIDSLYERLAGHLRGCTSVEALALCRRLDIPSAPMNRLDDLMFDPHLVAVGHFVRIEDERMGTLVFPANPVTFDGWKSTPSVPPRLGADTESVLSSARAGEIL